ncbi:MAG TPA: hypothetical protein VFN03_11430 [Trueperaceae bacterium]|nr:hypothetical protein [Trueperaceae bacterium]
MVAFTVGTEVLYAGRRFVITSLKNKEPFPVRLVTTTPTGPEVVMARPADLVKIASYTEPRSD